MDQIDPRRFRRMVWFLQQLRFVTGCVEWQGRRQKFGYGVYVFDGVQYLAHRDAWEFANGRHIPPGMFLCHSCDNPACVNPEHLWLVTPAQNHADMRAKRRYRNGNKRITLAMIPQILDMLTRSTMENVAAQFGVSKSHIKKIRYGYRPVS